MNVVTYTIYNRPSDYPEEIVCRRYTIRQGGIDRDEKLFARGRTLEEVRRQLPSGLFNLGREPLDDPWILEVWV